MIDIGAGDVCVNENGYVGIVTDAETQAVRLADGRVEERYVGVSGLGLAWHCKEPTLLGTIQRFAAFPARLFDTWVRACGYKGDSVSESQGKLLLEIGRELMLV